MERRRPYLRVRVALGAALGVELLSLSLSSACVHTHAKAPSSPRKLDRLTPQLRAEYIRHAIVWQPTKIASTDLLRGPQGKGSFEPDQQVTCDYVTPEKRLTGNTPKFLCDLGGGDVVKVKYNSGEVYAEVAASRLLWAIGFGSERDYAVQVTCRNCPIEPWFWSSEPRVPMTRFPVASIQRKLEGKEIALRNLQGWAWPELDQVDETVGGAPRAQRDALKLLAVFLQHSDSKAGNQGFLCLPDGVVKDQEGNEDCKKPLMYIHDVGLTFGKATLLNNTRVDLNAWQSQPVWKDPSQCVANQKRSMSGTLVDPRISEAGRKFLADLLVQLSDAQIRDMFTAARIERLEQKIHTPLGERKATIDDWVQVFKKKRDEVASQRCPQ
jgi:hypothetical protein